MWERCCMDVCQIWSLTSARDGLPLLVLIATSMCGSPHLTSTQPQIAPLCPPRSLCNEVKFPGWVLRDHVQLLQVRFKRCSGASRPTHR